MKHVKGVGIVGSNGKVIVPVSTRNATDMVVSVFDEKESLKRVLLAILNAGKSPEGKEEAYKALFEHETLYGTLDGSGHRPVGLTNVAHK